MNQNKILAAFTAKASEKLATFANVILEDDGAATELRVIDEQIEGIKNTIQKFPKNATLYYGVLAKLLSERKSLVDEIKPAPQKLAEAKAAVEFFNSQINASFELLTANLDNLTKGGKCVKSEPTTSKPLPQEDDGNKHVDWTEVQGAWR